MEETSEPPPWPWSRLWLLWTRLLKKYKLDAPFASATADSKSPSLSTYPYCGSSSAASCTIRSPNELQIRNEYMYPLVEELELALMSLRNVHTYIAMHQITVSFLQVLHLQQWIEIVTILIVYAIN